MMLLLRRLAITLAAAISLACSLVVDAGALNQGCPAGTKSCYGKCVSTNLPEYGCARPGCAPCGLQHATSNCSTSTGQCTVAECAPHFGNCDKIAASGCETNIDESAEFCGGCDLYNCDSQQGQNVKTSRCGFGACYVYQCEPGYFDCDGTFSTGCEVSTTQLQTDRLNCGSCGTTCATSCVNGICQ
jgi:hypothetical protein